MANEADQIVNTEEAAVENEINAEAETTETVAETETAENVETVTEATEETAEAVAETAESTEENAIDAAYEVENYAKKAYEHESTLSEAQIKALSKRRISKGELKRPWVLLLLTIIFVLYGLLFYYLPLGGWTAVAGDGQVTMGESTIFKGTARKVRRQLALTQWNN